MQIGIGGVAAAALLALGIAFLFFIPITSSSPSAQTPRGTAGAAWPLITDLLMVGVLIAFSVWMRKRQDVYNWKIVTAIVAAVCASAFALGFVWRVIRLDWGACAVDGRALGHRRGDDRPPAEGTRTQGAAHGTALADLIFTCRAWITSLIAHI